MERYCLQVSYMKIHIYIIVLFIAALFSCTRSNELGSKDNPFKFYLIPAQDVLLLQDSGKKLEQFLSTEMKMVVKVEIPTSYIAVVEAFGSKRVDAAILNTFGYVLAHDKYGAEPVLKLLNRGKEHYYGQIIAHKDGPKKIEDIAGKTFAFVDPVSSSGHLFPLHFLSHKKIKLKSTFFAGTHDAVVTGVYQKKFDAGATFYAPPDDDGTPKDARWVVRKQFPDIFEKIKVLSLTDPIPNDPVVVRKEISTDLKNKLKSAMNKYVTTDEGKQVLYSMYHITGFKDANDSDYQVVRTLLKDLNKKAEELVKK